MGRKRTYDYVKEFSKDRQKPKQDLDEIMRRYYRWKMEPKTRNFDDFWLFVNEVFRNQRGLLRTFNGTSFEEHICNLIGHQFPHIKERCFWGKDPNDERAGKVKIRLDVSSGKRRFSRKFDIAVYGVVTKPVCLIECKTFANELDSLALAQLCKLHNFSQIHVYHVTHLITEWDLKNGLKEFIDYATSNVSNFHHFKIGNLVWDSEGPKEGSTSLDGIDKFLNDFQNRI